MPFAPEIKGFVVESRQSGEPLILKQANREGENGWRSPLVWSPTNTSSEYGEHITSGATALQIRLSKKYSEFCTQTDRPTIGKGALISTHSQEVHDVSRIP